MSRPKVVLLGMLTKIPVGGVAWLVRQYAMGFERLGFDVYYVEAHGRTPSMFMSEPDDDPSESAVAYLDREMTNAGLNGRWAFHALHHDCTVHGMSERELSMLYRDAALIINLHGGTVPLPEHTASGRLIYLGTDPVDVELELHRDEPETVAYLEPHVAFFTWGLNHGNPDCPLPWSKRFPFTPSPPPVVMDMWDRTTSEPSSYTTIGNWRQRYRDIVFRGERLSWSKHHEFEKVLDLPKHVDVEFELALSSYEREDEELLKAHGWGVRPALPFSADADSYREYIERSRGEFSAAKQQNVHFRSGWFSERSATYLAAARPVILQDTGFGNFLPTGEGLLAFADLDEAVDAVDRVESDYERHRLAAREVARAHLAHDVVLVDLLDRVGLDVPIRPARPATRGATCAAPSRSLVLNPVQRRPLRLPIATLEAVLGRPVPRLPASGRTPDIAVIVVAYGSLALTRLTVESILANTERPFELIVVNNAADEATGQYLSVLAARNTSVRIVDHGENVGFAAGNNMGLKVAIADCVVLLNNDTIVTPGWEHQLLSVLTDRTVGLVVPSTNRCGNAAEIDALYETYGELLAFAHGRRDIRTVRELDAAVMFCVAFRRDLVDELGMLDEQFGIGTFEDDDYSMRVRRQGYRIVCAYGSFVHHFGGGAMGELAPTGDYARLLATNRALFEAKWGVSWQRAGRPAADSYRQVVAHARVAAAEHLPTGAVVLVVSKGDDALIELPGVVARHFPSAEDGTYAGHYPSDGDEAIAWLEGARRLGSTHFMVPETSLWWLDHYDMLRRHLETQYTRVVDTAEVVIYDLEPTDLARRVEVAS